MRRRLAGVLIALVLGHGASARANGPSRTKAALDRYAAERNLPVRAVDAGPAARRVTRFFVPILPEQFRAFQDAFTHQQGGLVIRHSADASGHNSLVVKPGDIFFWGQNYAGNAHFEQLYSNHEAGGYSMALDLSDQELAHVASLLPYQGAAAGNCMHWLPNLKLSPESPGLFAELGITRSQDGKNQRAKLLHGANDRLQVVGVHVASVAAFLALEEHQLLGPPPAGGVEDNVK